MAASKSFVEDVGLRAAILWAELRRTLSLGNFRAWEMLVALRRLVEANPDQHADVVWAAGRRGEEFFQEAGREEGQDFNLAQDADLLELLFVRDGERQSGYVLADTMIFI